MSAIKRLIWDIETSPNIGTFWRPSWKANIGYDNILFEARIISISYKWQGHKRVHALTWDENGDDADMLRAFVPIAEDADEMVAHNGDRFDIKWVNTRMLLAGLPPMAKAKTVDTLAIAKRLFNFQSNRLDYLAQRLLGEGKSRTSYEWWQDLVVDVAGAAQWRPGAAERAPAQLKKMVKYCNRDVQLLEKVFEALAAYDAPKSHVGVAMGREKWSCAHCGSEDVRRKKRRITAKGAVSHSMKCNDCAGHFTISDSAHRDYLDYRADLRETA